MRRGIDMTDVVDGAVLSVGATCAVIGPCRRRQFRASQLVALIFDATGAATDAASPCRTTSVPVRRAVR